MYRPPAPDGIRTVDPMGISVSLNAGKRPTKYIVRGLQRGVHDDYAEDDDRRFIWVPTVTHGPRHGTKMARARDKSTNGSSGYRRVRASSPPSSRWRLSKAGTA